MRRSEWNDDKNCGVGQTPDLANGNIFLHGANTKKGGNYLNSACGLGCSRRHYIMADQNGTCLANWDKFNRLSGYEICYDDNTPVEMYWKCDPCGWGLSGSNLGRDLTVQYKNDSGNYSFVENRKGNNNVTDMDKVTPGGPTGFDGGNF